METRRTIIRSLKSPFLIKRRCVAVTHGLSAKITTQKKPGTKAASGTSLTDRINLQLPSWDLPWQETRQIASVYRIVIACIYEICTRPLLPDKKKQKHAVFRCRSVSTRFSDLYRATALFFDVTCDLYKSSLQLTRQKSRVMHQSYPPRSRTTVITLVVLMRAPDGTFYKSFRLPRPDILDERSIIDSLIPFYQGSNRLAREVLY